MGGNGHGIAAVQSSGDARIDGILRGSRWAETTLSYGFPTTSADYGASYEGAEAEGTFGASAQLQAVVAFILDADAGGAADDGFSLEGFTALDVQPGTADSAQIRVAQTRADPYDFRTAWAYYPGTEVTAGDVWLSSIKYDFSAPRPGSYAALSLLHEIGHALGLAHGHTGGAFDALPADADAMEYSVMTYRSYAGGPVTGFSNETWSYAQSYMMLDIAALQHMYGADYTANAGDTVYSWTPGAGITWVDGAAAISPGGNRIFATIWDGGGIDSYDLSAYGSDLAVDLRPGAASVFSAAQLADLGNGYRAQGNIYNALLYQQDPRSLIENARGGSGDDRLTGNRAANRLSGGDGDDSLFGLQGNDRLDGGDGRDDLHGGSGRDRLSGRDGNDRLGGDAGRDTLVGGANDDRLLGGSEADRLTGGAGNDRLFGQSGADRLDGGAGNDLLVGGSGADLLTGGADRDLFRFVQAGDSPAATPDRIADFTAGVDRIDLSGLGAGDLVFLRTAAFSGAGGELRFDRTADGITVLADLDGDARADFALDLAGLGRIAAADFLL